MLCLMVEAAIHWMQVGLPLKILKIVILARYESEISQHPLLSYFRDLKMQWSRIFMQEKAEPKVVILWHYLSFMCQWIVVFQLY